MPLALMVERAADLKRFLNQTHITNDPKNCWQWIGSIKGGSAKERHQYGMGHIDGRPESAHRISWLLFHGAITKDSICHTCDNYRCVNPTHLWEGTHAENMADMVKKGRSINGSRAKTHCKHGHEFSKENTKIHKHGYRICIACSRHNKRVSTHIRYLKMRGINSYDKVGLVRKEGIGYEHEA